MVNTTAAASTYLEQLAPYLNPLSNITIKNGLPASQFLKDTPGLHANAYYFGQPQWAECWLKHVHMSPLLRDRWHATGGSWNDKVVVDVGCGPGNMHKNIGDKPRILIGVDVSEGTLKYAQRLGLHSTSRRCPCFTTAV